MIRSLPGVFFIYDMSPFVVHRTEESQSFFHFLVRMCAVVGGVFTVSALVDRVINFALNGARKREAKGAGIGYIFQ